MTRFPLDTRNATLSSIMRRFSSSWIPRASVTWKSQVFPNMQHHSAGLAARLFRFWSSSGLEPCLRVLPNAVREVFSSFSADALERNSSVPGLDPGHPHSTKSTPKASRRFSMSTLSSHENDTPSHWAPSRRVVS